MHALNTVSTAFAADIRLNPDLILPKVHSENRGPLGWLHSMANSVHDHQVFSSLPMLRAGSPPDTNDLTDAVQLLLGVRAACSGTLCKWATISGK